ncbi:hypothetical protein BDY17DRAFT_301178 [Neohortaea acidophila]|uniref:Armadillo-type protein n=1 Tax=Neohortaea acidophila TaxID=245834 RepID=A0A6A6PQ45_9PEZI|nr:uncharacterized protein BDY17DRAFT_301178 [Neohortaea acidophila]KAF2481347.1 hypothetical protein BDY17DRAFT_301178 [Neohortaea acidophila]
MPRARKRASSVEAVEEVAAPEIQEEEEEGGQRLEFDQPLTWRPGKQIPVTELLSRLRTLAEELESIEQEDAHRATLVPKAQELASEQLIGHKDKGVRAYAMLCIVEMFRLLAPDAPYKKSQLREIFTLFTSTIVPALADPSDSFNQQHNAILTSLTTVKSIILLTDITGSDKLMLDLFTNCFDVLSGVARGGTAEKLPKNLEYSMTSMLCTLVDESTALPSGVVDIILAQFLRADPNSMSATTKKGESKAAQAPLELPPAYNMALSVCNTCADKMNRYVGQYFGSVLIDASETVATTKVGKSRGKKRTHDESDDESIDGMLTPPAENDLLEVEKAHRLLRELWRSSPDVIQNVVPQIEAEIEAESPQLRMMAVQTVGDMIAGIGAAGPPSPAVLDPAAYPPQRLEDYASRSQPQNPLLQPRAPHAFSSVYSTTYQRFVERHKDKSALVRSAWVSAAGRILATSGGGKGLDDDQEKALLDCIARLHMDNDERVRLAAVQSVELFDFHAIIQKIGKSGGVKTSGSILCNLADRMKDTKQQVHTTAMVLLARIWGVAAGAIAEGDPSVHELLGGIPSKIFEAMYVNKKEINATVLQVLFDCLLPVSYPPIKAKQEDPQRSSASQREAADTPNPDALRAERILVFIRDLEDRAKVVFFRLQQRRPAMAKYVESYLKACEAVNSGEKDGEGKSAKKDLDKMIAVLVDSYPDAALATEHLKKFAKHHDRRSYQLIRFCLDPASDYRKVVRSMKELTNRFNEAPSAMSGVRDTILPLVRSAAILVYNRSHVPAIAEISRTDERGLGAAAHDVLKEISTHAPQVFRVHVHELCESLKKQTPRAGSDDSAAEDTLKACAGFARRFPEGLPKDREFYKAMVAFAAHGQSPKAAKHAVTVITSSADKKEMYIKEIQTACIDNFTYGDDGFLARLASIAQLKLLANKEYADLDDSIMDIAIHQVLLHDRTIATDEDLAWSNDLDEDISAKLWALKILVNGLRGMDVANESTEAQEATKEAADKVYKLLNTLIRDGGELSKSATTPTHHKAQLRLAAAIQLLKLSCNHKLDHFLTPADFNRLSSLAQDSTSEIRAGFVRALKRYLGTGVLPNRFYALAFLYAFEPTKETMQSTVTWLKSRAALSAKLNDGVIEGVFVRLLSLLAHHPDFSRKPEELEDFLEYIMFYLKNVATQAMLPTLYGIAQRLKQVQDGIDPEKSENLYVISDLAEAIIRHFAELKGWSLQVTSGRIMLPSGLFRRLAGHTVAQDIASTRYLPDELAENLEDLVKNSLRPKKRKSDATSARPAKKPKTASANGERKKAGVRKVSKASQAVKKIENEGERRKSNRASSAKNYAEDEDSEGDDEEVQEEASSPPQRETSAAAPADDDAVSAASPAPQPAAKKGKAKGPTKSVPLRSLKQTPTKNGRATRAREKDIMDVPSDSE